MEEIITEQKLLQAKKEAGAIRDKIISAKSTMASVEKNISEHEVSLTELGVKDVNNVESTIEEILEQAKTNYNAATEIINSYNEAVK